LTPTPKQMKELGEPMSTKDMSKALRMSKNGSAPGIDSDTYKLWKALEKLADKGEEGTIFSPLSLLTEAVCDLEENGMFSESTFAQGWMCPIYKKNARDKIENYRPITLLNADYKIYTKALSIRLGSAALGLIHEAQAGFIPGRQISDQTQLIQMVMNHAEAREENGMIVALDQEKAYDKIAHDYLWRVLEGFGLPTKFVSAVKSLYSIAETSVGINGFLSKPFHVGQGVRQGDPLSCLLFNLAIEPLAISLRKSNLEGVKVPNQREQLIATLFADDTTVYLSKNDDWEDLQKLLKRWCLASRAKFNVGKTEIIPIGSEEYRSELITSRAARQEGPKIPDGINIVEEGKAVRILGAWFGNKADDAAPWVATLSKLDKTLGRWNKVTVTTLGRKNVVQTTIGGYTQYLTQVQGMPKNIELLVEKRLKAYLWKDKTSRVNIETVHAPISRGGLKMLDISARNKAITIMWLKRYLDFTQNRPLWANFADSILADAVPRSEDKIDPAIRINPFLQKWKSYTYSKTNRPRVLDEMLEVARKYGICIECLGMTELAASEMPIWLHPATRKTMRRHLHAKTCKCLIENHKMVTIGDTQQLVESMETAEHKRNAKCTCTTCAQLRQEVECQNPEGCKKQAKELLNLIPKEWKPKDENSEEAKLPSEANWKRAIDEATPDDLKTPSKPESDNARKKREKSLKQETKKEKERWNTFDKTTSKAKTVADIFRVFTEKTDTRPERTMTSQRRQRRGRDNGKTRDMLIIGTDGSCTNNGEADARAGSGGYADEGNPLNFAIRVPKEVAQTNQTGEMLAVTHVATNADTSIDIFIESDSQYTIKTLTTRLSNIEDRGYIGILNRELIQATIARLRQREGATTLKWVKGHAGHERNEEADIRAAEGAEMPERDGGELLNIGQEYRLTGAKLATIMQKLAYQGIREIKMKEYVDRASAKPLLEAAKEAAEAAFERKTTEAAVWRGVRHKDITKETRLFLWLAAHDGYWLGKKWDCENFPDEIKARQFCKHCGTVKDMAHILTTCNSGERECVWAQAEDVWRKRGYEWENPNIGLIIGCGTANFRDKEGSRKPGDSRLFRILIAESAYAIWKMRCQRVIPEIMKTFTRRESEARWRKMMNDRIDVDREMTNKEKLGKQAIDRELVEQTWAQLIQYEPGKPGQDWRKYGRVLVGTEDDEEEDEADHG
jgi:ribonuclease HI